MWPIEIILLFSMWAFYFDKVWITGLNRLVRVTGMNILICDPPYATITTQKLDEVDPLQESTHK